MTLILSSTAFDNNGVIPEMYTCENATNDGRDISPPLSWTKGPEPTQSFVLICDDHDVPKNVRKDGIWDHWVVFNVPATTTHFPENIKDFPKGTRLGKNSSGSNEYQGPCPPDRQHTYNFHLYALDCFLNLEEGATKAEVYNAMKGHILEEAVLKGVYNKKENRG